MNEQKEETYKSDSPKREYTARMTPQELADGLAEGLKESESVSPLRQVSEVEQAAIAEKRTTTTRQRSDAIKQLNRMANSMLAISAILFLLAFGMFAFLLGKGDYFVSLIPGSFLPFMGKLLGIILKDENKEFASAVQRTIFGK